MVADRIVSEIFPDETGAARLAQVGLFILIFLLEGDRAPVTAIRIDRAVRETGAESNCRNWSTRG